MKQLQVEVKNLKQSNLRAKQDINLVFNKYSKGHNQLNVLQFVEKREGQSCSSAFWKWIFTAQYPKSGNRRDAFTSLYKTAFKKKKIK